MGGRHTTQPPAAHPLVLRPHASQRSPVGPYLPCWEGGCPFLLAWGVHVTDSKVLGDLLHVLEVEERVEAGFIYETRIPVAPKFPSSPQFSSAQQRHASVPSPPSQQQSIR